ncbi:MAG TPA: DUF2235 domain-containing protein [Burkholderiaceae bacterium]|nr:DUF2235 domain-containing protein [Burkholderiaceae bacterium]
MKPCSVTPIIALSLLLSVQPVYADCGPSQIGPPCAFGGMAAQGSAEPSVSLGAGNPIHLATGNKYQHDIDLPANATAPGLELVRHYNALDPRASVLGHGWTLSYDARLYRAGSAWQIVQADGRRLMFPDTGITQDGSHIGPHGRLDHIHDHHNWFWPTGTTARFDQNGRLVALRHPNGESVYIERDDTNGPLHGTIQRVVNDRGQALEFSYTVDNDVARLRAVTTPLGKFKYDHDTEPVDTAKSSQVAGPVNRQTDVSEYDQHPGHTARGHRLIRVTRPDGMTRSYAYDADHQAGNPYALTGIAISTSAGNKPVQTLQLGSWSYDAQGRAVSYRSGVADEAANHLRVNYQQSPSPKGPGHTVVTDGQGRETHVHIALRGRQYRVTAVTGEGCQGCPAPGTRADYDEDGRLVSVNGMGITRTPDGRINVLRPARAGWPGLSLHYDAGRRTHWHSDITGTEHMQYNAHGLPAKRRFANDDTVRFDYDAQHRPVAMHERHGTHRTTTRLRWHGHWLTHIEHPNETETRHHDAKGRVTQRGITRHRNRAHRNNGARPAIQLQDAFTYDDENRLTQHHLPEGGSLHYEWGHGPQLTAIYWEDRQGHKHPVIQSKPEHAGYFYGNGLHLETRAGPGHRIRELRLHGADHVLFTQELAYDSQQRIATETVSTHSGNTAAEESTWAYAYDEYSRLIGYRDGANPTNTHWLAWDGGGAAAAVRDGPNTRHADIDRDASGLPTQANGYTLSYGAGRRLQAVHHQGQPLVQYRHNAFGYRIRRENAQGQKTDYFYLDNRMVAEMDNTTTGITRRYIYAHHVPVAMIDYSFDRPAEQLLAVHADVQGAPRLVTDHQQRVRWHAHYTPLGQARIVEDEVRMDLRLPGQVADPDTGWHDNLLRTYLPEWGHYLEPDPLGPVPGNQVFGYANQQPRRYADPTGLLLFAFDGTRYSEQSQGNVWKMSQYYLDGPVHYHGGPGNSMFIDLDAITAHQASQILDTQWKWLLLELSRPAAATEVTPIDILGFSRGAALARHFGNMISQHTHQGLFQFNDPIYGAVSACVDLRFMGLFDTVAQFGVAGSRNHNYDLGIAAGWEWVAHAVAMHERRWLYPLTSAGSALSHNVVEAPFIGAHADIGGGIVSVGQNTPADSGDLSNVALQWMLWQARAASVPMAPAGPDDTAITNPILNDYRPPLLRTIQDGDRRVDAPDGSRWLNYQDDHIRLGRGTRRQTESLIQREPDWERQSGSKVGVVDMDGYARWLQEELGWQAVPV